MSQIYNIKSYNHNFLSCIFNVMMYFAPKKITRASFLFARVKFIGIRSVVNTVRLDIKKP